MGYNRIVLFKFSNNLINFKLLKVLEAEYIKHIGTEKMLQQAFR